MQKSQSFQSPQINPHNLGNNKPLITKTPDLKSRLIHCNLDIKRPVCLHNQHKPPSPYKMVGISGPYRKSAKINP